MEERMYLENILTLTKSLINLYMNGTVEASTKSVRKLMEKKLNNTLNMQNELFNHMQNEGYYKIENVKESDINKLLKKICKE